MGWFSGSYPVSTDIQIAISRVVCDLPCYTLSIPLLFTLKKIFFFYWGDSHIT